MKYSKVAGNLRWSEGTIVLRRGQSIDDDHPLAKERPDLFDDEEPGAEIRSGVTTRVETGVQAPGEFRAERGSRNPTRNPRQ